MHRILILTFATLISSAQLFAQAEVEAHVSAGDPATQQKADDFNRASAFGAKYFNLGDYKYALEQYVQADALMPNHPGVLYNTALVLTRMGRFAEARAKIETYLQLYPAGLEVERIKSLRNDLDFERELEAKQQQNQSYVELFNRAKFNFEKQDYATALKLFQEAEQQRPEDAATLFNQALAWEAIGDYDKAIERLRAYQAVSNGAAKSEVDQRIFSLESEINDRQSSFVCPFCGFKIAKGSPWCPRCWHGPYQPTAAAFNTRSCQAGGSVTRTSYYANDRVEKNEDIACSLRDGSFGDVLRYSKAKQRAIQLARREQGWQYEGEVLSTLRDRDGNVLRLVQGPEMLEKIMNSTTGEVFTYSGHSSDGKWYLDREEFSLDGQKYAKRYTYDTAGKIASETVRFQNGQACGHIIQTTATYIYAGEQLSSLLLKSGYNGFEIEGAPQTEWSGTMKFTHDPEGRLTRQEFVVDTFTKTYTKKAFGPLRAQIDNVYPTMRIKKPLDLKRQGDICSVVGAKMVMNAIDLRPFFSAAPDLAVLLNPGVQRVVVNTTYPAGFKILP
jgi:tetratricopeptide (TPR) repeat protein